MSSESIGTSPAVVSKPSVETGGVVEALRGAKSLVANGWIKHWPAQTATGRRVDYKAPDACSFCAAAATARASGGMSTPVYKRAMRLLEAAAEGWVLSDWNDAPDRTQSDVLALFDKAIALAEQNQ